MACEVPSDSGGDDGNKIKIGGAKYSLNNAEAISEYSGGGTTDLILEGGSARYTNFDFEGTGIFVVLTIPSLDLAGTYTEGVELAYAAHLEDGAATDLATGEGAPVSSGTLTITRNGDQLTVSGSVLVDDGEDGITIDVDYSGPVQDLEDDTEVENIKNRLY